MKRHLKIVGVLVAIMAIVGLVGTMGVIADSPDDAPVGKWGCSGGPGMMSRGGRMGEFPGRPGMPEETLEIIADVLGLEDAAALEALLEDQTLREIVEETEGVEMEDIHDAMMEAREAQMREAIEANEDLDDDHKAWLLQGLDNGWGCGMSGDFRGGMRGGFRGGFKGGMRFAPDAEKPTAFGRGRAF